MPAVLTQLVPLTIMQPGEVGIVRELSGDSRQTHHLEELGIRDGATVRMIRNGSPSIVAVNGHRFSLRFDPTTDVWVELEN